MKRLFLLPVLLLSLAIAGCATIPNPASPLDIYRAKLVYAGTLQLAVDYRQYCWSKPYAVIVTDPIMRRVCERRRAVVRAVQTARPKVAASIRVAENFVTNNPTLNAGSALTAMWTAVNDFKSLVPSIPLAR